LRVKSAKPAEGYREILIPGEPEERERAEREEKGIPVDDETWKLLLGVAGELGVELPQKI